MPFLSASRTDTFSNAVRRRSPNDLSNRRSCRLSFSGNALAFLLACASAILTDGYLCPSQVVPVDHYESRHRPLLGASVFHFPRSCSELQDRATVSDGCCG